MHISPAEIVFSNLTLNGSRFECKAHKSKKHDRITISTKNLMNMCVNTVHLLLLTVIVILIC